MAVDSTTYTPLGGAAQEAIYAVSSNLTTLNGMAKSAMNTAMGAVSAMLGYSVDPVPVPNYDTWPGIALEIDTPPDAPDFEPTSIVVGDPPASPPLGSIDFSGLDALQLPGDDLPASPLITIPPAPTLSTLYAPGAPPALDDVLVPEYAGEALPEVPTLQALAIPDAPDINFDVFQLVRPDLESFDPTSELYHNDYVRNAGESRAAIFAKVDTEFEQALTEHNLRNGGGNKAFTRLGIMLDGGTGLPSEIEQALFDRAVVREDATAAQAVAQAHEEWAARGFSLPGSTLLARVSEARRANRDARGALNREITIQMHQQGIENLRFAVQQGIAAQGQMFDQYFRMYDAGRQMADRAFEVAKSIFDAKLEIFKTHLMIYQADIQAEKEKVQVELAKLEVFKAQLDGERIRNEINTQNVAIYTARLQGVLAGVEVFKAQIEGANAQIRAQASKVELHRSTIEAYKASLDGERIKFDVYDTRIKAELAKVNVFDVQVRAYSETIKAFATRVGAEGTKVDAKSKYAESAARMYAAQVEGWRAGVSALIERLRATTEAYKAQVSVYAAKLNSHSALAQVAASQAQVAVADRQASMSAAIDATRIKVAQMQHASTLGLEALKSAATVSGTLAGSAMSAINVGATIQGQGSGSDNTNHNYHYSGEI